MKSAENRKPRHAVALALVIAVMPVAAQAYVGPGAGLTAIGTMVALLAALILAVVGFVWYPVKRMMRASKAPVQNPESGEPRK